MIVSNRRYEITLHGDLHPYFVFYFFISVTVYLLWE
nr:MAG TPA: hypothetical protein [Caudoviricetes sp.]